MADIGFDRLLERQVSGVLGTELKVFRKHLLAELRDEFLGPLARDVGDLSKRSMSIAAALRVADMRPKPGPDLRGMLTKVALVHVIARADSISPAQAAERRYPDDKQVSGALQDGFADIINKAVTNPASRPVLGWAADLIGGGVNVWSRLAPASIYAQLSPRGIRAGLSGGTATASILARPQPGSLPPPFIAEGHPFPIRRLTLRALRLAARRVAVASYVTSELAALSTPAAEELIGAILADDIMLALDGILLNDQVRDATRPSGLLAGVTATPPASSGDAAQNVVADLAALLAAINQSGPVGDPVFILGEVDRLRARLLVPSTAGLTMLSAWTVPAGRVIALDAGDFASLENDELTLSTSLEGLLHGEDASPRPFVSHPDGLPPSATQAASPSVSLWQQDLIAFRVGGYLDWGVRPPSGRVAFIDQVDWS